jgi:glycosyltransferase involved in cell wall biosynthesis
MKIGILVAGLPPENLGGTELQAAHVAGLLARNHQVTVWTRSENGRAILAGRRNFSVEIRKVVNLPMIRFPLDILSTLSRIGRARQRPDVIIAYQTVIDGVIGALAKRLFGIPLLVFVRAEKEYKLQEFRKSRTFAPFVFKTADRIIVQSSRIRNELLREFMNHGPKGLPGVLRRKLGIIPNGVSFPPAKSLNGNCVLFVGRLVQGKGVEYLIAAMERCSDQQLVVVGDGPERRNLEKLAVKMANVAFVGEVPSDRVTEYFQRARMFVLPSLSEGSPNVVLEAMAHGVPVIATAVGGIPDLVNHGETGFLTQPGNISEIVQYVRKLADDEPLRRRLGNNCLGAVRYSAWDQIIALYEAVLGETAPNSSGRREPSSVAPRSRVN